MPLIYRVSSATTCVCVCVCVCARARVLSLTLCRSLLRRMQHEIHDICVLGEVQRLAIRRLGLLAVCSLSIHLLLARIMRLHMQWAPEYGLRHHVYHGRAVYI